MYLLQHEDASLEMFDHLVVASDLAQEMERYGLILPPDLTFIKEMIKPLKIDDAEVLASYCLNIMKPFVIIAVTNVNSGVVSTVAV